MDPLLNKLRALIGAEQPIRFDDDEGAQQLVALLKAERAGAPGPELLAAFEERERQVCKAARNGRLVLDYRPVEGEGVRLPPAGDPLYAQALVYWAAELDEPIMRMAEACRRAGEGALPVHVKEAAKRIAFEARTIETDRLYLSGFGEGEGEDGDKR